MGKSLGGCLDGPAGSSEHCSSIHGSGGGARLIVIAQGFGLSSAVVDDYGTIAKVILVSKKMKRNDDVRSGSIPEYLQFPLPSLRIICPQRPRWAPDSAESRLLSGQRLA